MEEIRILIQPKNLAKNLCFFKLEPHSTYNCYMSCNDVVKFDTGDNVTLLQTKPSLLCHVTGVVMMLQSLTQETM